MTAEEFGLLRDLLQGHTGVRFWNREAHALAEKLRPRLVATGSETYLAYYHHLKYGDVEELAEAIDAVVDTDTHFFRDYAQLESIVTLVAESPRPSRILSLGCATGEEPYSLAMLLHHAGVCETVDRAPEIVAVDISRDALRRAERAIYTPNSFRGRDGLFDASYFEVAGPGLHVVSRLRSCVRFKYGNIVDPPTVLRLRQFDAIICRNVLSAFTPEGRASAGRLLERMVTAEGVLFVDGAERLAGVSDAFSPVEVAGTLAYRLELRGGPGTDQGQMMEDLVGVGTEAHEGRL